MIGFIDEQNAGAGIVRGNRAYFSGEAEADYDHVEFFVPVAHFLIFQSDGWSFVFCEL